MEKDNYYKRAAIEMYKERWLDDPLSYIPFTSKKFARLWFATESGANSTLILMLNLPIYALFVAGVVVSGRRPSTSSFVLTLVISYFVVIHVAVFAYFRYVIPIMPYIILLGASGGLHILRLFRDRELRADF